MNFKWWHLFQIFRIRYEQITSPTSLRVQGVAHEHSRKDFCADLMHSTLVVSRKMVAFYFFSKSNGRPSQGELSRRSQSGWPSTSKSCTFSEIAITLHCFCPEAFLKPRLNQYSRSSFFHSSYCSFCNSVCFRSVRSRSFMIPIQFFAGSTKIQRVVQINGSQIFFWV